MSEKNIVVPPTIKAQDDIEFMATPFSQTPECTTPGTFDAEDKSDGAYFNSSQAPDEESFRQRQEFSLPPVDGGKDAWLFLSATFVVDALTWGMCFFLFRVAHSCPVGKSE